MSKTNFALLFATAAYVAGVALAERPNQPEQLLDRKLAEIRLENGNVIEFHEPEDGIIFFTETGIPPNPPALASPKLRGKKPVGVFRALDPGRDVPPGLIKAQDRAEKRRNMKPPSRPNPDTKDTPEVPDEVPAADPQAVEASNPGVRERSTGTSGPGCSRTWWEGRSFR